MKAISFRLCIYLLEDPVFLLEVGRSENNLVLLQPPCLPGPPGRLLVLVPLLPILVVLEVLGNGVLLPLLDFGLGAELLHIEGSGLGVKLETRSSGESNVLGGKVKLNLELSLTLLLNDFYFYDIFHVSHVCYKTFSLSNLALLDST